MPIDYDFLRDLEGFSASGYIPEDDTGNVIGKSGVTIGTGIDLGQQSAKELIKARVPRSIVTQLKPYLGKRNQAAAQALQKQPLALALEEVEVLNNAVIVRGAEQLAKTYKKATGKNFQDLPERLQTVAISVSHQYGHLPTRTPKFWEQVTKGNVPGAISELENFGDSFATRRKKEATYLDAGQLISP